jgi:hypothetical protein
MILFNSYFILMLKLDILLHFSFLLVLIEIKIMFPFGLLGDRIK